MRLYTNLLLLAFSMFLGGCSVAGPPIAVAGTVPLDAPFTLAMNEVVRIDGEPATIRLEPWVDDKRCPSDVECAESGPVKVQITLWREGRPTTYPVFTVHTDDSGAVLADAPGSDSENKVGPYRIAITEVSPFPAGVEPIDAGDYRATFVVGKDPTALPDTDADMNVLTDTPFTLAPGEQVTMVGTQIVLRVAEVIDTRCAAGAGCEEGSGKVEVVIDWTEGETARQVRLSGTTDENGKVLPATATLRPFALMNGAGFHLVRVEPVPAEEGQAIAQGDYRVTLMLEAGPRAPFGSEFADPGVEFSLTPEHAAVIGQDVVRVLFDGVLADSRCPTQVECVQAGDVQIGITVFGHEQRATSYVLGGATDEQGVLLDAQAIEHDGYTVRLLQVAPYPDDPNAPIDPTGYVASFVVDAPEGAVTAPEISAPEPVMTDAGVLPLLCINDFAVIRMNAGGAEEQAVHFTEAMAQTGVTDYAQAHAACNKTFGPEWVQAGPSNVPGFAVYLPEGQEFWVWDGMAGGLVRYTP